MKTRHYDAIGWTLFIVCAVLYAISSAINGDIWAFIGSLVFFCACVVFLIPLATKRKSGD